MLNRAIKRTFSSVIQQNLQSQSSSQQSAADLRTAIIKASLLHVNKFGWNSKAIQAGCNNLNLSSASHGILKNGAYDLVDYVMAEWNTTTSLKLRDLATQQIKQKEKIAQSVKIRLQLEIPFINTWNEAMALGILPQNANTTREHLWRLVDDIWFFAGDRSTDFNYYSKRVLLLGVYASTELHLLTDKSTNFNETWKFLDRRIEEAVGFGLGFHQFKDIACSAGKGLVDMTTLLKGFPEKVENNIEDIKKQFKQ